jgi:hypothetical protein
MIHLTDAFDGKKQTVVFLYKAYLSTKVLKTVDNLGDMCIKDIIFVFFSRPYNSKNGSTELHL